MAARLDQAICQAEVVLSLLTGTVNAIFNGLQYLGKYGSRPVRLRGTENRHKEDWSKVTALRS
jgi:hypothetical protein